MNGAIDAERIAQLRALYEATVADIEKVGWFASHKYAAGRTEAYNALPELLRLAEDGLRLRTLIAQIDRAELIGPDERSAGLEWVSDRIDDMIDTTGV